MEIMNTFKRGNTWFVRFTDHAGHRRKMKAASDKRTAENIGRKVAGLVSAVGAGESLPDELVDWVFRLDAKRRNQLMMWGLISDKQMRACDMIEQQIDAWAAGLESRGRRQGDVDTLQLHVKAICEGAKFSYFRDVDGEQVLSVIDQWRRVKRVPGSKRKTAVSEITLSHYLRHFKQFTRWMRDSGYTVRDPMAVVRAETRPPRRGDTVSNAARRRALTSPEQVKLIATTTAEPHRFGMDGQSRALVYRIALATGWRQSAIRRLTAASIDQSGVLLVTSENDQKQSTPKPITPKLLALLNDHARMLVGSAPLFQLPNKTNMARMLRADCEAADIDTDGVDFHALRHTFGTTLAANGVHPKTLMALMDHSDVALTMRLYTHSMPEGEQAAILSLPDLDAEVETEQRKDGA